MRRVHVASGWRPEQGIVRTCEVENLVVHGVETFIHEVETLVIHEVENLIVYEVGNTIIAHEKVAHVSDSQDRFLYVLMILSSLSLCNLRTGT